VSELIQARWVGGYPVEIAGQGVIEPGGLAMVPKGEAQASDHWEPTRKTTSLIPDPEESI
jgi:hypothetical protein